MHKFYILQKGLGHASPLHFAHSPDQISWSDCLHFLRYWAICAFKLFVLQQMMLSVLKLPLAAFLSSSFLTWPKNSDSQDKNLNILTLKRLGINFISPVAFPKKYLPDGVKTCSFVIFNIIIIHYFVEHRCIFVQMNRYGCPKIKPKFFRKKHSKRT